MANSDPAEQFGSSLSKLLYGVPFSPLIRGNAYTSMENETEEVLRAMDRSLSISSWHDNMKGFVRNKLKTNFTFSRSDLKTRSKLKGLYQDAFQFKRGGNDDPEYNIGMVCIAYLKLSSDAEYARHDEIAVLRGLIQLMCYNPNIYNKVKSYHDQFWETEQIMLQRNALTGKDLGVQDSDEMVWLNERLGNVPPATSRGRR